MNDKGFSFGDIFNYVQRGHSKVSRVFIYLTGHVLKKKKINDVFKNIQEVKNFLSNFLYVGPNRVVSDRK